MVSWISALLLAVTFCMVYILTEAADIKSDPVHSVIQDISHAITNLARDLSIQLANGGSKCDIISPVSIGSSLLLLMRIATGGTRAELLKLLHLDRYSRNDQKIPQNFRHLITELLEQTAERDINSDDIPTWLEDKQCGPTDYEDYEYEGSPDANGEELTNMVRLANAIFVQNGFLNNTVLEEKVRTLFLSIIENVDFYDAPENVTEHINKWANSSTNGRISQIISDPLSRDTTMVIANALYFKAYWEEVFIEGGTRPRKFFPNGENDESVEADIMAHSGCFPYYSSASLDARIMGFPYKNRTTTMYVILPNNSNRKKLQQLVSKVDAHTLDQLIRNMTMRTASVFFPKMHITNSFDLKAVLEQMGVSAMFRRGTNDFSSMNKASKEATRSLRVSGVMHKVDLEVNEAGTEGGAVTVTLQDRMAPAVNFRVLTPFLVAIRHDITKLLLFYGPVYDPS
ncbi:serine protease inhibitor 28Dc-like isoform X1 [Sabethes cyaneus]|uniref:serine protease inhibitor 28Dc-like isoform X1 n=1 Tax=Sabethes cyaneus TaxID=53552 RepID=UPI00237E7C43|nr:serine protease inhibitor 28Dc-like isoform X1 [Sabethes cyaneus]XP_053696749.1 serine protease inhibitor 28Dc-like isoform X1 [Sabethes cyaneus]XP_053696750.1 serine protease inhibitor 28Dc-like isoform X1 [Sabethes cyaneus]